MQTAKQFDLKKESNSPLSPKVKKKYSSARQSALNLYEKALDNHNDQYSSE